ncbi:MAG: DMT family transporter, partial [Hyphomicrobium aestuarii]|nr:DMT family transporter [Hyphomicrobium aestuarii]
HWTLIVAVSTLWGASFFFNAVALKELPPLTIVWVRIAGGALVLALVMMAIGQRVPPGTRWRDFAVMGLLANALPFALIVSAQTQITSGLASVLNASTPVWTVLVAHAAGAETATPARLFGVAVGIAGVTVLIGPTAFAGETTTVFGMAAIIAGTVSYAFASLWGRRFREVPSLVTSTLQLGFSAAMLLPVMLIAERPWTLPVPGAATIAALTGAAVLSTALAFVIFFKVMAEAGAINAMLVTLLVPVSAIALGTMVLDEPLTAQKLLGAAIITAGLVILDGRAWRWLKGT